MATSRDRAPGVKGAKVKILTNKKGEPRTRLPKQPLPDLDATDLQEQSTIYLAERNAQMRAKRLRAEMELAVARDDLIERPLVIRQLQYMLISMRQRLLAIDAKVLLSLRRKPESTPHEIAQVVRTLVLEALAEVADLPNAADPNWLEKLEEDKET